MDRKISDGNASNVSRRQFITSATMALGAVSLIGCAGKGHVPEKFPYVGRVLGANDRINIACIGVGGKGDSDSNDAAKCGGNIVALCDVDTEIMDRKANQFSSKFSNIKKYQDYRVLLDEMGKDIDAVTISTPDHHHGTAAILAMGLGKHCFCQKPLVQTVSEARIVRKLALKHKLATQMGNQGSAEDGLRRAIEVIQAGVIGKPLELHVWSNRPVWPQGYDRPSGADIVPATLNWDQWLGPAQARPYKKSIYHTFAWRGWYEFGTGALGDMACHTVNMPFRACRLGYPNVVECEKTSQIYSETFPKTSRIRFEFPQREGLPPLKFWWYDGNPGEAAIKALRPGADTTKEIIAMQDTLPGSGALIIGEKGKLFSPDDYGARFWVAMNGGEFISGDDHEACKAVPQTIPRCPGGGGGENHMREWFTMMRGGPAAFSNFEIAGYLAEVILLGCIALRVGEGKRMEWDGPNMRSKNLPAAAQFVQRTPRAGWKV